MAQAYRPQNVGTKQAHVVVVHCSDPRYQPHFQDFLRLRLGLPHYGLIAIPGGAQMFSPSEKRESLRDHGMAWMDFMATLMSADRCILIGHGDCRWYLQNGIAPDAGSLRETQARDLFAVRDEIQKRLPALRVEIYFAQMHESETQFSVIHSSVDPILPGRLAANFTDYAD
jgi:hypothetical protein